METCSPLINVVAEKMVELANERNETVTATVGEVELVAEPGDKVDKIVNYYLEQVTTTENGESLRIWILIGMAVQALTIGAVGTLRIITIDARGQAKAVVILLAIFIVHSVIAKGDFVIKRLEGLSEFSLGAALQSMIIIILVSLGVTTLLPEFLLIAAGYSLAIIVAALLESKSS